MSHAACSKQADSDPHYTPDCEEPVIRVEAGMPTARFVKLIGAHGFKEG